MGMIYSKKLTALLLLLIPAVVCALATGCHSIPTTDAPTELNKIAHPDYTIGPPDILMINVANLIPRPPYRIAPFDGLLVRVTVLDPGKDQKINELLPGQPIDGLYRVEVTGDVNLGFDYGSVPLGGKTIPEAKEVVQKFLKERFKRDINVVVAVVESRALQQIRGEHLVRPDGKVMLGVYGSVFVSGLTPENAKIVIETHLSQFLFEPIVSVDVAGYNSKVYYVIVDFGTAGKQVTRFPVNGNETVLDALGNIKGLPAGTDSRRIHVARPMPIDQDGTQVMPVDWKAIACGGSTATNYQLLPGDRVYVNVDPWVSVDQHLAKFFSPIERVLGITLLGHSVVNAIATPLGNTGTNTIGR